MGAKFTSYNYFTKTLTVQTYFGKLPIKKLPKGIEKIIFIDEQRTLFIYKHPRSNIMTYH